MTPVGVHNRLAAKMDESEARLNDRLALIEAKQDAVLRAAGIDPASFAVAPPAVQAGPGKPPSIADAVERDDHAPKRKGE